MKRSEINQILREAKEFLHEKNFLLPPWAYWTIDEWRENRKNAEEIFNNMLGWDITDFGSGDFYDPRGSNLFAKITKWVRIGKDLA